MARVPFNVLVYPYRFTREKTIEYALLRRVDNGAWQGVSGGGQDDESPLETARREAIEEIGIPADAIFLPLDATEPIPAPVYRDSPLWGDSVFVVPQYGYGVQVTDARLTLSPEHSEYCWLSYQEAYARLRYNQTPLWELNARLLGRGPRGAPPPH
jgi:dihydroneopterin triphosphate diphosphatase